MYRPHQFTKSLIGLPLFNFEMLAGMEEWIFRLLVSSDCSPDFYSSTADIFSIGPHTGLKSID